MASSGQGAIKRISVLMLAALLALGLSVPAAAQSGPFCLALSWTGDASSTMTATWRDGVRRGEAMQAVPQTEYDKTGFDGALSFDAECRDISLDGSGAWHYEATASGLAANTVYVYRVGCEGAWSETNTFTTGDPASDFLTFAYMGDVQPSGDSAAEYALWGKLAESAKSRNPELAFAVLGGDIVNSGISMEQFDLFRENAEGVFSGIPLFSAAGNHESNFLSGKPELLLDYFAAPENGPEGFREEFYSFDAANCHILVLNSWIFSGEQKLTDADFARVRAWLAADLASSQADWQIVVTHVPIYAVHSDAAAAAARESWEPVFQQYGVDLVFEGHQHVYSRSYPLYDGKIDYENGITYIMGVSGSKFYDSADETLAQRTIYNTASYQLVQADGDTLTVRTLDMDGNELDYISLRQRACEGFFADVPAGAWYSGAAAGVQAAGLFGGVGGDMFDPDGSMSRAMLAAVLHRFAGAPEAAGSAPFTDVPTGRWYSEPVSWAAENHILEGFGNGVFAPDGLVTAEELITALYRFAEASPSGGAEASSAYGAVSPWAAGAMGWAEEAGLFAGVGGELSASGAVSRAQAAGILMNFMRTQDS